jgi:hypothetical protein
VLSLRGLIFQVSIKDAVAAVMPVVPRFARAHAIARMIQRVSRVARDEVLTPLVPDVDLAAPKDFRELAEEVRQPARGIARAREVEGRSNGVRLVVGFQSFMTHVAIEVESGFVMPSVE